MLHLPGGPGVRIETHLYPEYVVPPYYDSLLAKVIAHGCDRQESLARMRRLLAELIIEGIATTIPFHRAVLSEPNFVAGRFDTEYVAKRELNSQ